MKPVAILLVSLLVSYSLLAQTPYQPFLSSKAWYEYNSTTPGSSGPGEQYFKGDTAIINNKIYTSIVSTAARTTQVREDTAMRKVYELTDSGEIVLYSFASIPGQIDTFLGTPTLLDSITSWSTYSGLRRAFWYHGFHRPIIEGIGNIFNGDIFGNYPSYKMLHCCYNSDDQLIYRIHEPYAADCGPALAISDLHLSAETLTMYPNPAQRRVTLKSYMGFTHAVITAIDVQGRSILHLENFDSDQVEVDIGPDYTGFIFFTVKDQEGYEITKKVLIE